MSYHKFSKRSPSLGLNFETQVEDKYDIQTHMILKIDIIFKL